MSIGGWIWLTILFLASLASSAVGQEDRLKPKAHYRPPRAWLGDVHPQFWGGQWHLAYLEVPAAPLRQGLNRVRSREIVSRDLIHWQPRPVFNTNPQTPWWLIANLQKDGRFYSFYNGPQGIDLAISDNGTTWSAHAGNPVIPYPAPDRLSLRDPNVFFDQQTGEYGLVLAGKKMDERPAARSGVFYQARSRDLIHWDAPQPLYDPGNIGVPECPDLFALGGRYYLLGNWGIDRVGQGRYRWAERSTGPWRLPEVDSLDSGELMAPNTASDGQRRLLFGWVPTYEKNRDFAPFEWGGHLAFPREIYCDEEGKLFMRPPRELLALRTVEVPANPDKIERLAGQWTATPKGLVQVPGSDYGEFFLPGQHERFEIETELELGKDCPQAGLVFRTGAGYESGYEVAVDREHQLLLLRPHLERQRALATTTIRLAPGEPVHLRVFVDGEMIEAFLNDRYSLAGRALSAKGGQRAGFYSERGGCRIKTWKIYPLREVYTEPEPPPLQIRPQPDPKRATGSCVLFPESLANVYCPFQPVLNFKGSFTLECWVRITPGTGEEKANLIVKGDGDRPGYHYGLNIMPGHCFEFFYKTPGGFVGFCSPPGSLAPEGTWMHLAGVLDLEKKEIRLYRDGKLAGQHAVKGEPLDQDNKGALRVGFAAGLTNANPFFGLIDEVRLWEVARTSEQIATDYHRKDFSGSPKGLVVHWSFDKMKKDEQDPRQPAWCANEGGSNNALQARLYDGAVVFHEDSLAD